MTNESSRRSGKVAAAEAPTAEADSDMTGTYVRVVIVEAIVIFCLWLLGRAFS
jgi:hypothetical protein